MIRDETIQEYEWEDRTVGRKITKDEWKGLLQDRKVFTKNGLRLLKLIAKHPEGVTCKTLGNLYGGNANSYNGTSTAQNRKIADHLDIEPGADVNYRYWPIMFIGRNTEKGEPGDFAYKVRPELLEAMSELEGLFDGIPETIGNMSKNRTCEEYGLNTILYGPPGTGKTYNVKRIAVEIIDRTAEDIEDGFGPRIARIVCHESEDKHLEMPASESWEMRKREFLDSLRDAPYEAKVVALADKLSNMRSMAEDFERLGDSMWEKFNQKDKAKQA